MSDENPRPYLVEERRDGLYVHPRIVRAGVGCHLPEELVERLRVARELHAGVEVRPRPNAEDAEPELLVGRGRDVDGLRRASRAAPPRLVDEVDGEAAAQ